MKLVKRFPGVVKIVEVQGHMFMDAYLNRLQSREMALIVKRSANNSRPEDIMQFIIENMRGPKAHRRADLTLMEQTIEEYQQQVEDEGKGHYASISTRRLSVPYKKMSVIHDKKWPGVILRMESETIGGDRE